MAGAAPERSPAPFADFLHSLRVPLPHPLHSFAREGDTRLLPSVAAHAPPLTRDNGVSPNGRHGGAHETLFPYRATLRVALGKHMAMGGGGELAAVGWRGRGGQM